MVNYVVCIMLVLLSATVIVLFLLWQKSRTNCRKAVQQHRMFVEAIRIADPQLFEMAMRCIQF